MRRIVFPLIALCCLSVPAIGADCPGAVCRVPVAAEVRQPGPAAKPLGRALEAVDDAADAVKRIVKRQPVRRAVGRVLRAVGR